MEFHKEKIRFLVESCRRNEMSATATLKFINNAWGNDSVSRATVYKLFADVLSGTRMDIQHDNAHPHVAASVKTFLAGHNVCLLPQPPYSPDTNMLDRRVFSRLENNR